LSLFQNPVGFGTSSWKNRRKPGFSFKSKEAVPKAEVLEQPQLTYPVFFSHLRENGGGTVKKGRFLLK
jgi:hypothetical protein